MRQLEHAEHVPRSPHGRRVELVLAGLKDPLNVGQAFRIANSLGVGHLHLCGATPKPPAAKVARTARGAQHYVPWSTGSATAVVARLQTNGLTVVALELATRSRRLTDVFAGYAGPVALVVGHEAAGIDPKLLAVCDTVAHIPLYGRVSSLNVATALAIGVWEAVR